MTVPLAAEAAAGTEAGAAAGARGGTAVGGKAAGRAAGTGRAAASPRPPAKQPAPPASTGSPSSPNDGDPDPAPRKPGRLRVELGSAGRQGAGFLLGLMVWGWVALPFLKGGPSEVKKVLMAKFLNKSPSGAWLP